MGINQYPGGRRASSEHGRAFCAFLHPCCLICLTSCIGKQAVRTGSLLEGSKGPVRTMSPHLYRVWKLK